MQKRKPMNVEAEFQKLTAKLDRLQTTRAEKVARIKELESELARAKAVKPKTDETWRRVVGLKGVIQRLSGEVAKMKPQIAKLNRRISILPQPERVGYADLSERFDQVSDELTDATVRLQKAEAKLKKYRALRRSVKGLLSTLAPIEKAARELAGLDTAKNIYSSTSASIWSDELVQIHESAREVADTL